MSNVCQNCGREHEGTLIETFKDGDNNPIDIVVCNSPRYKYEEQTNEDLNYVERASHASNRKTFRYWKRDH